MPATPVAVPETDIGKAGKTLKKFTYSQLQMAMPMRITVWCESQMQAETACKLAFERAADLVKVFSDYDPMSETSRLTGRKVGIPTKVSDHLFEVLRFSRELNHIAEGAFDPTAGSVIRLWRSARKTRKFPKSNEIENAIRHSGFKNLRLNVNEKTVTLFSEDLSLDFGGIAKGYIGDQVIRVLHENGIDTGCYEAGGDFVLSNSPPNTNGWVIDIGKDNDGKDQTLVLSNCGVSTSGDAQQFVEIKGQRYSHVVDPRTGIGVTTGRTAFVIAPTGMQSDSLATTGCVLSEPEFQKVIAHYDQSRGWSRINRNQR